MQEKEIKDRWKTFVIIMMYLMLDCSMGKAPIQVRDSYQMSQTCHITTRRMLQDCIVCLEENISVCFNTCRLLVRVRVMFSEIWPHVSRVI